MYLLNDVSSPKELHEPTLHFKPDIAREVEEERQKGQVKGDPLKMGMFSKIIQILCSCYLLNLIVGVVDDVLIVLILRINRQFLFSEKERENGNLVNKTQGEAAKGGELFQTDISKLSCFGKCPFNQFQDLLTFLQLGHV